MTLSDRVARRKPSCIKNGATRPSGSDAQTSRPHRRHAPPRPPKLGKRRPPLIEAACSALARLIRPRERNPADRGRLYHRLAGAVIVAGYSGDRILHRVRAWRADGAESVVAVLMAMIRASDIRSGLLGQPRVGGGPWHRYTVRDLAQYALGAQDRAAIATTERALRVLTHAGLVRCDEVAVAIGDGEFRAEAGVRRLNWHRLAEMLGLGWLLARDRAELDRRHGAARPVAPAARRPAGGPAAAAPAQAGGERRAMPAHVLEALAGLGRRPGPA